MLDSKYIPLSIEDEQRMLLGVVKHINEICEKEDIQYFLGYGSLLGAVRHKGFIPWDDDIDIMMTRENYNKFSEAIKRYSNDRYFFQNYITDSFYPVPEVSRLCINNTYKWPKGYENAPFHTGIYVDIFPLEYGEKKKEDTIKKMNTCSDLHKAMYGKYGKFHIYKNPKKMILELRGKFTPIKKLQKRILSIIVDHKYGVDRDVLCNYGAAFMGGDKLIYESKWFTESIKLQFCGLYLSCPIGYDEFLRHFYGDNYMTPIKTKAERHIGYEIQQ